MKSKRQMAKKAHEVKYPEQIGRVYELLLMLERMPSSALLDKKSLCQSPFLFNRLSRNSHERE